MTLKIEVYVPEDDVRIGNASTYLANALSAIGFVSGERVATARAHGYHDASLDAQAGLLLRPTNPTRDQPTADDSGADVQATSVLDEPSVQQAIAKRERGKPSQGRARRTKEEIAEDEKADAADAAINGDPVKAEAAETERMAISSGDERVDPSIVAQDAADEAAESAAARASTEPTLDDLRRLMGDVQRKHGMPVAAKLPVLIGKGVADLTDAEIPAAMEAVRFVLENGLSNVAAETAAPAEPVATKQELVAAMLDYALFADGQNTDHAKMPNTMQDVAVVFGKLFGAEVSKLSQVPADGYAKAIGGIAEMKAKDVFKRARG